MSQKKRTAPQLRKVVFTSGELQTGWTLLGKLVQQDYPARLYTKFRRLYKDLKEEIILREEARKLIFIECEGKLDEREELVTDAADRVQFPDKEAEAKAEKMLGEYDQTEVELQLNLLTIEDFMSLQKDLPTALLLGLEEVGLMYDEEEEQKPPLKLHEDEEEEDA